MNRRWPPLLLFAGTLLLYGLTMSYVAADYDGAKETWIMFAWKGLRPFHLLHSPLNHAAWAIWRALGWRGPAFVPLQWLNTLLGAVTVVQLWLLALRCGLSQRAAGLTCAVFVLSATPWLHCRTAETSMTPMPFAFGAFLLLLPVADGSELRTTWRAVAAGLLMCFSMLLTLNMLVLIPAQMLAAWLMRRRRSDAWMFLASLIGANLVAYGIGAVVQGAHSPSAFLTWFFHHDDAKGLTGASHNPLVLVMRAAAGIGRLFFPVSWGETALKAVLRHQQVKVGWDDWLTFARNSLALLAVVALSVRGWLAVRREPVGRVAAWALLGAAPFNVIWLGSDPQYWLPVFPFLLVLSAVALTNQRGQRPVQALVAVLLVMLVQANLPGTTPSPLWPHWGAEWQRSQAAAKAMSSEALLIVPGNTSLRVMDQLRPDITYCDLIFTADDQLEGAAFLSWLAARIDEALHAGHAVYVEGLRAPLAPEYLGNWEMVRGAHQVKREEVESLLGQAYRVGPAPGLPEGIEHVRAR